MSNTIAMFRTKSAFALPPIRHSDLYIRTLSTTTPLGAWTGRSGDEHAINKTDNLDVQSDAVKSGKEARARGDSQSQATGEHDDGNYNEKAKKDHPKAPTPVIGMNDERGAVSPTRLSLLVKETSRTDSIVERQLSHQKVEGGARK